MAKNKDVKVNLSDPSKRAAIEAKRGIERDEDGRIIRSNKWRKERVAFLDSKIADMKQRIKNCEAEKKAHLAALK